MMLRYLLKFVACRSKQFISQAVITFFLISLLQSTYVVAQDSEKTKLEMTGFYKNLLSVTDVRDNFQNLSLTDDDFAVNDFQRLRLKFDHKPTETVDIKVHYELRTAWGETTRIQNRLRVQGATTDPEIDIIINPRIRQRFLDLESRIQRESNFLFEHSLDRLRIRYQTEELEFTLGRQAVSWGTGLVWNPTDLFSGFAPTEIDRDEKSGVDVVRVIWVPAEAFSLDLIVEPLDKRKSYSIDRQDSSLASRATTHFKEYDISLVSGLIAGDWVIGGDFTGYLKDAGLRGEWIYTSIDESDERDYFRALLSVDYAFQARWDPYIALEYLYNGLGTSKEADYLKRLADSSVQRAFQRGNAFNVGRNYLALVGRLTLSALVTLQSTTLWNIGDNSVREFLAFTWSLSDDIDFLLGCDIGFGDLGTEFGGFSSEEVGIDFRSPNLYFAFLKFYF